MRRTSKASRSSVAIVCSNCALTPAGDSRCDRLCPLRTVPAWTLRATVSSMANRKASCSSGVSTGAMGATPGPAEEARTSTSRSGPPQLPKPRTSNTKERGVRRVRMEVVNRQVAAIHGSNGLSLRKFCRRRLLTLPRPISLEGHLWAKWAMTQLLPHSACSCSVQSSGKKRSVWKRGGRYCCQFVPPVAAMSIGSFWRWRTALR